MNLENTPETTNDSCRIPVQQEESANENWLADLDGLDKLSFFCLFLLIGASLFLIFTYDPGAEVNVAQISKKAAVHQQIVNPELESKLKIARNLLAANNLEKCAALLSDLTRDYPYNGMPYMLMGDIFIRKQQPVLAMYEFKKGVDLNPDFLDKKTKLFQGKKIKNNLAEVKEIIEKGLAENPSDAKLEEHKKALYYMQRKVAGSCG